MGKLVNSGFRVGHSTWNKGGNVAASLLALFGLVISFGVGIQDPAGATDASGTGVWLKEPVGSQVGVPVSLAVGPSGEVLETQGNLVIKMSADGSGQSSIGSGFNSPSGVAVSTSGRVFVADSGNSRIISMNLDGTDLIPIGSGFSYPQGIAVDNTGRVFVADTHNSRIVSMNPDGTDQVIVAQNTKMSGSWLQSPTSVALDNSGHLFAADTTTGRVWKMSSSGSDVSLATVGSNFSSPQGVAADSSGRVFVADSGNSRVVAVNADGSSLSVIGSGFSYPFALAVSNTGRLLVADSRHSRIVSLNPDGTDQTVVSEGFNYPKSIAVDADGRSFIADTSNNRIIRMNADGTGRVSIGSGFSNPAGVAVDGAGHVYVADLSNNRVVKMNADGSGQTSIGAGFSYPAGVAVDGAGHVYVADSRNNVVIRMNTNGVNILTITGFSNPSGVAVDAAGRVYVASAGNDRVVVMNSDGSGQTSIGVGFSFPSGVAVDPSGRLWVADRSNGRVVSLNTDGTNQVVVSSDFTSPWGLTTNAQGDVLVADSENNRVVKLHHASPPSPPTISTVSRGDAQATVAWTEGADNGASITSHTIKVFATTGLVATKTDCLASPCVVTGLTNGLAYTFKVSDTNGVGEGALSVASIAVTPAAVPSAPTITSATRGNTQATIAWTDGSSNGSDISSQTIYVYSGASLVSTKTNCTGSPCTVTGLSNGTSYTFKVSDSNGVGEGALSGASSAVTPVTYPGSPQNVSIVAAGGQAVVSWTPPTSNGGSPIISYSVSTGAHSCSYTVSSPETDTCTITGLTNGSSYTFSVTATNGVGSGSASTGGPTTVLFPAPVLTSAVTAKNQITLTWTAPTVTDGKIVSFTGSAGDGHGHNFYCSGAKSATKCTITGLTDLTTYTTSVKATENKGGTISASSNTISATPAEPLTLPYLHPVTLTSNPHTVTIIWGSASGGDGQTPSYRLKVFNADGSTFYSTQTTGNTATASGLTKGAKYTYTITTSTDASVAGWIPAMTTKAVKFTGK